MFIVKKETVFQAGLCDKVCVFILSTECFCLTAHSTLQSDWSVVINIVWWRCGRDVYFLSSVYSIKLTRQLILLFSIGLFFFFCSICGLIQMALLWLQLVQAFFWIFLARQILAHIGSNDQRTNEKDDWICFVLSHHGAVLYVKHHPHVCLYFI